MDLVFLVVVEVLVDMGKQYDQFKLKTSYFYRIFFFFVAVVLAV